MYRPREFATFLTPLRRAEPNTTYAAVSAALVANLVLFAYIVMAFREDAADKAKATKKD